MSLDHKPKGNPNWTKGKSGNPTGRTKGSKNSYNLEKVQERLRKVHKLHPVDKLVMIAIQMELNGRWDEAADIWTNLLKWCEPSKKPVETAPEKPEILSPEKSKENALKLLEEMESIGNGRQSEGTSNTPSLGNGQTNLSPEASSTPHIPGNPEQ